MIYRLQRKFILVSTVSVLAVVLLVFALITAFNVSSMNRNLDLLADRVSEGGGRFPNHGNENPPEKPGSHETSRGYDFITPETPFSTRHFTVWFDGSGQITRVNIDFIHSVDEESAVAFAERVMEESEERGWTSHFRYKRFPTKNGEAVVFIDGSMNRSSLLQSVTISAVVLLGCATLVLLLTVLLSKRVVKPIAESYEKQRQFITDANHELKTPLTLILANLDIAEAELGQNEWLEDIREEGHRMTSLVDQLVALSRMDEETVALQLSELAVSEIAKDMISEFTILAEGRGRTLTGEVDEGITCMGDEVLIRRLLSILLDNAVKYCDEGGEISVTLKKRRQLILTVENTYAAAQTLALDRLFDRFYRADQARTFTGGYGVGLSIAKSIAEKHKGEITAYRPDATHVGFKVVLRI